MKFVFFIRHYNDADQILPFISYLSYNKKAEIIVYTLNKEDQISSHISYINNVLNIKVINFYDNFYHSYFDSAVLKTSQKLSKIRLSNKNKIVKHIGMILVIKARNVMHFILSKKIARFIGKLSKDDVVMGDFATENYFPHKYLISYSQNKSIRIVAWMHGFYVFSNLDSTKATDFENIKKNIIKWILYKYIYKKKSANYYDCYIVANYLKNTYFKSSMFDSFEKHNRVIEIGMPRYTYEWNNEYHKTILKGQKFEYKTNDKINVVMFLSSEKFNVNNKKLKETLFDLSLCKNINFVYKPHTRAASTVLENMQINALNCIDTNSVLLSEWADIGIIYGCSIGFQLLLDDTLLILPTYIDSNRTVFEDNNVCYQAKSLRGLIDFISNKSKEEIHQFIQRENVSNFIESYAYGGRDYNGLMESYYKCAIKK
ncbi:hypothetical protein HOL24_07645 [bacterium]|jgi:hypothetical protein|nr:hypothetical protein [bacterium]